jgi:hypothetical protein
VADGGDLYQLHNTGKIWKCVGPPLGDDIQKRREKASDVEVSS